MVVDFKPARCTLPEYIRAILSSQHPFYRIIVAHVFVPKPSLMFIKLFFVPKPHRCSSVCSGTSSLLISLFQNVPRPHHCSSVPKPHRCSSVCSGTSSLLISLFQNVPRPHHCSSLCSKTSLMLMSLFQDFTIAHHFVARLHCCPPLL